MNIADIMLNKRIDEAYTIRRGLFGIDDAEVYQQKVARYDHLKAIIRRGLVRCYPCLSDEEIDDMLFHVT